MENRFGIKDLGLYVLVAILIIAVVVAMKQYDRQWSHIQAIETQINQQTGDLARIQRMLLHAGTMVATTQGSSGSNPRGMSAGGGAPDVDPRVRQARAAADFAEGDAVVDVFQQIPDKLTPLISSDLYSQYVQGYVLDSLLDRNPNTLEWIPRLANKWSVSPDGKVVDFTIRSGVTFSDGSPLTADDVVFTIELTMNEAIEAPRLRSYLDKLDKCVKVGDNEVRFIFKDPYFMALETAATTQVLSKKFYSQFSPKEINESTGFLLGSGPYRLRDPKAWKPEPDKPIELVRNERYWGEQGGPDRLMWRVISLPAAEMAALRNGEIDVFYQPTPEQFNTIKADKDLSAANDTYAMDTLTAGYFYIGWNEARGGKPTYFADKRVRQAMTLLIDRKAIVHDVMHDLATVASGPYNRLGKQADPSVEPWPYDPPRAIKLLADAGFVKKDDVLYGPDGKEFSFEFMYGAKRDIGKQVATYVHDAFARAGIVVKLAPAEWSTMLENTKERNFDAVFMGWGGVVEDDLEQIFSSTSMKGVGDNFVQYSNPEFDRILETARFTPDAAKRTEMWHQLHRIIHEDQPYTFMFADKELDAVNKRFEGVLPTKLGIVQLKNEWYVPRGMQKYTE